MMSKNEIEARMRWIYRSRQAENVGKASPPNLRTGRGTEVGSRETPAALSAEKSAVALSAYRFSTPYPV